MGLTCETVVRAVTSVGPTKSPMFAPRNPAIPSTGDITLGVAEVEPGVGEGRRAAVTFACCVCTSACAFSSAASAWVHAGLGVQHRGARGRSRGQIREIALHRIVELLLADRPALRERRVAGDVELRLTLRWPPPA